MIRIGMLTDNMKETLAILSDEDVIEQLNEELPTPIICYGAEFYNERVTLKFGNERNPEKAIFLSSEDTDAIRKFCTIRLGRRDINIEKFHFMREGYVNSPAEPPKKDEAGRPIPKNVMGVTGTYKIKVKSYMLLPTEEGSDFDFMKKWNNNIPMPLMIMVGDKVKETKGMVFMKLHGDITSTITQQCLRCGRDITNPVSQYFGMGPKCGHHNYTNPFPTEEELYAEVNKYRKYLQGLTWEGWIPKSAIVHEEKL